MSWQAVDPLTHENAHGRPEDLDPRVNGPFLDDVRDDQERAYRESRNRGAVDSSDTVEMEPVEDDNDSE